MYKADVIAKYVINRCIEASVRITNLKLQKLLYLTQVEFLKQTGSRLIDDDFYAWKLGPVIPSIYNKYSVYAGTPLPKQQTCEMDLISAYCIEKVLSEYAMKSTWDLIDITRAQDPWKYNYQIFGNKSIIPYECIVISLKQIN